MRWRLSPSRKPLLVAVVLVQPCLVVEEGPCLIESGPIGEFVAEAVGRNGGPAQALARLLFQCYRRAVARACDAEMVSPGHRLE